MYIKFISKVHWGAIVSKITSLGQHGLPQVSALCRLDPPKERPVSMMEAGKSYAMSNTVACIFHFLVIGYIYGDRYPPTKASAFGI